MKKSIKLMFLICVAMLVLFASGCAKEGYVASNTSVMGIDISSMSKEEAMAALEGAVLDATEEAVVMVGDEKIVLSAGNIGAKYNVENTVDFVIKESQGFFAGWIIHSDYGMSVDVDEEMLDAALASYETEGAPKSAEIAEDGIIITNAYPSKKLDRAELTQAIDDYFGGTKKDEVISMEYTVSPVKGSSDSEILSEIQTECKEPEYIMDENGTVYVTESSVGVSFDMDEALKLMEEHTAEGEVYLIPCEVKKPAHTKEELEKALFRDTLGTYKTNYASSSANRCSNIALATGSINEMILMPGDVFSFNNALGERTTARGYKSAGAYVAGETVQQVGGGICQVSSTLYNTVLLSNLEIVERRSHQMTVSYVPMGRDATVNWGTTDFRFKNNTEYPIKLVGKIEGKSVTLSIVGTETIENKKVEIVTNVASTLAPPVETIEDPSQEIGYSKTTQNGAQGYIVEAARVVYSGNTQISREVLTKSRYNPKKTIVTVGTKQPAPQEDTQMPPGLLPPQPEAQEVSVVPGV